RDVAGNGPLQKPLQDRGRFVAHGPRSLRCGRQSLRFRLSESRAVFQKNPVWRYPSGRLPPGEEVGGKAAPTHGVRPAVRQWLWEHRKTIRVYWLPPYSPSLNLIERLWGHLKRTILANMLFKTLDDLVSASARVCVERR